MSQQFVNQSFSQNNSQSSFGLSPNAAALISYLFVPITSIVFIATEKQNRLVRFHAWQSLFYGLGLTAMSIVLGIVIGVVSFIVSSISPVAGFLITFISFLLWIALAVAIFASWILCLFKAWRGEFFKLPVVGKFAENMCDK